MDDQFQNKTQTKTQIEKTTSKTSYKHQPPTTKIINLLRHYLQTLMCHNNDQTLSLQYNILLYHRSISFCDLSDRVVRLLFNQALKSTILLNTTYMLISQHKTNYSIFLLKEKNFFSEKTFKIFFSKKIIFYVQIYYFTIISYLLFINTIFCYDTYQSRNLISIILTTKTKEKIKKRIFSFSKKIFITSNFANNTLILNFKKFFKEFTFFKNSNNIMKLTISFDEHFLKKIILFSQYVSWETKFLSFPFFLFHYNYFTYEKNHKFIIVYLEKIVSFYRNIIFSKKSFLLLFEKSCFSNNKTKIDEKMHPIKYNFVKNYYYLIFRMSDLNQDTDNVFRKFFKNGEVNLKFLQKIFFCKLKIQFSSFVDDEQLTNENEPSMFEKVNHENNKINKNIKITKIKTKIKSLLLLLKTLLFSQIVLIFIIYSTLIFAFIFFKVLNFIFLFIFYYFDEWIR